MPYSSFPSDLPFISNPSPTSICRTIVLPFKQFRVTNVVTAQSAAFKEKHMTIFTIDEQNNITAFAGREEATAASTTHQVPFTGRRDCLLI